LTDLVVGSGRSSSCSPQGVILDFLTMIVSVVEVRAEFGIKQDKFYFWGMPLPRVKFYDLTLVYQN
jgi:hypothetical protein